MRKTTSICRGSLLRLALEKKKPLTGDQEIDMRNGEIDKARRRLLLYIGAPLVTIVLVLVLIALLAGKQISPSEGELGRLSFEVQHPQK